MPDSNPFRTPAVSIINQSVGHSSSEPSIFSEAVPEPRQRRFKSARLVGEYEKPWVADRGNVARERWDKVILWGCVLIGLGLGVFICWNSWKGVPQHDYCLVLDDSFATLDNSTWGHEIQTGGFGTGSFDWTTDDPANSYVSSDGLHIMPTLTLQDDSGISYDELVNGYTLNLTATGECTATGNSSCTATSNSTRGVIINPVRSARLTTAGKKSITYGRVEVVAKMPRGDWLWPAIWMMPEQNTYGIWPASGEIDIAEIRGNNGDTYTDGVDSVSSSLHWGPSTEIDAFWRTSGKHNIRRSDFSDSFHTYGLEWSEDYLFTYLDSKLLQVLYVKFGGKFGDMYTRGMFSSMTVNGSIPTNPWSATGHDNTPFDQNFYLILNVAVGGTNGFFPDSMGGKPWVDGSTTAMRDFWKANSTWLPTWGAGEARSMTVKSVKMWQQGACGAPHRK